MSHLLTLSRKDVVNNGFNNTLRYEFPSSGVEFRNTQIALHSINLYNSAYNVDSSQYGNNTFSIEIPTAATTSIINVTLADGYYSYSDINNEIQRAMIDAGAYLIDGNKDNVFYLQISENSIYYSCQLDLAVVPQALPSGFSLATTGLYSTSNGLPDYAGTPRLIINNEAFGRLLGFSLGTYPHDVLSTASAHLSNTIPQINPISNYVLRCNVVKNPYTIPSDILTAFSNKGTVSGQMIDYQPNEHLWLMVSDGSYTSIVLTICDQEGRFVKFKDTDIMVTLALRSNL